MEVMGKSTITGKYQVTLPKSVREILGANNGDLLIFVKENGTIVVKRGIVKIDESNGNSTDPPKER